MDSNQAIDLMDLLNTHAQLSHGTNWEKMSNVNNLLVEAALKYGSSSCFPKLITEFNEILVHVAKHRTLCYQLTEMYDKEINNSL